MPPEASDAAGPGTKLKRSRRSNAGKWEDCTLRRTSPEAGELANARHETRSGGSGLRHAQAGGYTINAAMRPRVSSAECSPLARKGRGRPGSEVQSETVHVEARPPAA